MHDVFISYSSVNKATADAICHHLETNGIRCWYAPRDIQISDSWASAIMEAIRQAKVFVLVYSKESNASGQVLNEVTNAFQEQCVIIPFRLDQTQMCDDLAYYLNSVHWLDASEPELQNHIENLCQTVQAVLAGKMNNRRKQTSGENVKNREEDVRSDKNRSTDNSGDEQKSEDGNRYRREDKKHLRKKRKKFIAVILAVILCGAGVLGYFAGKPQEMKFFCVSHIGTKSYLSHGADMISADGEQLFLQDRETGVLSLVNIEEPYQVLTEIRDETEELKNMQVIMKDDNEYIYFLDTELHTVKVYNKDTQEWITTDESALPLTKDESLYTSIYLNENLISDKNRLKDISLLFYDIDPAVDCISKIIHLSADGGREIMDVSSYGLQHLMCIFDIPGTEYIMMMDKSDSLKILDIRTGQLIEADHQTILDDYMPHAVNHHDTEISPDRRYVCQREFLDEYIQVRVWDLETGNYVYDEKFPFGCDLQFSGEKEFLCFDYKTMSLISCDLETGRTTTLLENSYFEKNKFFLKLPFSFYYSREFDVCFFVSVEEQTMGNGVNVKVTMIDRDGKVLAESEKIRLEHGNFYPMVSMQNNCLVVLFTGNDAGLLLDLEENTVIYRALYTVDKEGNMVFSDTYN